jgi:hypothetical protein
VHRKDRHYCLGNSFISCHSTDRQIPCSSIQTAAIDGVSHAINCVPPTVKLTSDEQRRWINARHNLAGLYGAWSVKDRTQQVYMELDQCKTEPSAFIRNLISAKTEPSRFIGNLISARQNPARLYRTWSVQDRIQRVHMQFSRLVRELGAKESTQRGRGSIQMSSEEQIINAMYCSGMLV